MDSDDFFLERFYGVFKFHDQIYHYDKWSLFIFDTNWKIRQAIVWLVEWRAFKNFILLDVLVNSIMMAAKDYSYRLRGSDSERTSYEELASKVFITIFFLEFLLKVIAQGFILRKFSYMRNGFNVLDFICLITGIMEQSENADVEGLVMLRMLRVLKPLRPIKAIPKLQLLI